MQDLANVNLLHGGMPCAEEKLAGCDKPLFDMGFRVDPGALTEERAATAVAAPLQTSQSYLPCNTVAANPWAVYGEPVAELCHARCVQPHLEAVGRGDKAAADAAWTAVLGMRSEATAWLSSGTDCSQVKDLMSCGNERIRTGALDWTWVSNTILRDHDPAPKDVSLTCCVCCCRAGRVMARAMATRGRCTASCQPLPQPKAGGSTRRSPART